ncbi:MULTISPECIES: hypothetical protein [Oceanimonas]|uniref:Lipoprotein n=1 Tax=Oceanimonas smirnovii TaxID=264574 RepID=A0ABW7P518_9GAMM|nr:hypothetical protein [Oceanimonas smirnovii]
MHAFCCGTVFVLLLTGCASSQERALSRLDEVAGRVLSLPCAQPVLTYRQLENPHVPGLIDEIETVSCPGLEAQVYLSSKASRPDGMPIYLLVSKPHPALPEFLQPGSDGHGMTQHLGKPASRDHRRWQYGSVETTETVTVEWQQGLIKTLRWEWYFD